MHDSRTPGESRETGHWKLARSLAALAVACWVSVAALITASGDSAGRVASVGVGEGLAFAAAWTAFPLVGTLIVRRRPGNAIGWLCVIGGLQVALFALLTAFATWSLATQPASFVGVATAWLSHTLVATLMACPVLIMMRFPSGRVLGSGWRGAERAALVFIAGIVVAFSVEPMPLFSFPTTPNPLGIGPARLMAYGPAVVVLIWFLPIAVGVAALVVRYRRGSAVERLQIRSLAAASVLLGCAGISMPLTSPDFTQGRLSTASSVAFAVGFSTIPLAIGIAIVRYRLYDIDRLIKRTLVYAVVSGVLAAIYGLAVLGMSAPLSTTSAAGTTLTTAAATLLVALLFRPVRARVQVAVDRRFDRERYEAGRIVDAFAGRIQLEAVPDGIVRDLLRAIGQTVHPSSTGCWIRATAPSSPARAPRALDG